MEVPDAQVVLEAILTALRAGIFYQLLLVVRRLHNMGQAIACPGRAQRGGDGVKPSRTQMDAHRDPPCVQQMSAGIPVTVAVGGEPTHFENDVFKGSIVFFAEGCPGCEALPSLGRMWEMQVQGRFKRSLSCFYLGLELSQPLKGIGLVKRSVAYLLIGIIQQWYRTQGGGDLQASLGDLDGGGSELPHLCSSSFSAVDEVWETPLGEAPPQLGLHLLPADAKPSSKADRSTAVRTDVTYTFTYFSTNVDLFDWKIVLPGKDVDLASLIGQSSIRIAAYTQENDGARHVQTGASTPAKRYFHQLIIRPPPHVSHCIETSGRI